MARSGPMFRGRNIGRLPAGRAAPVIAWLVAWPILCVTAWGLAALLVPFWPVSGPLLARGMVEWREDLPEFGGLSGLVTTADGQGIIALSDRARLFHGLLRHDGAGRLAGASLTGQEAVLSRAGNPLSRFTGDSEDLAWDPSGDGSLWIAFEGETRVARFLPAPPTPTGVRGRKALPTAAWNHFESLFGNTGFEALAVLPDGRIIAIPERDVDNAAPRIRVYAKGKWHEGPELPGVGHRHVSGAAWGPDGRLWVLEREIGLLGPRTRIRSFALQEGPGGPVPVDPRLMLEGWLGLRAIWEGIALRQSPQGIVVSLVSDNNFSPLLQTRLAEFLLPAGSGPLAAPPTGH